MTWTYGDPLSAIKDEVRLLIGDTDSADPQLTDEEINYLLGKNSNDVYLTGIAALSRLITRYARRANKSVGNLSLQSASISKQYKDALVVLKAEANRHTAVKPYAGGVYTDDLESAEKDTTLVQPSFAVGRDDILGDEPTDSDFTGIHP